MKDLLPGGKADKIPPSAFPKKKVDEGAKVESEHTSNKTVQREIARDHLSEDMSYYSKLKKMEKKATIEALFDELQKIATGLAPAGAPTVKGMGSGMAPKVPGLGKMPKAAPTGLAASMPSMFK